jgi:hypothetical protein
MTTVNTDLARFAAAISDAYDKVCADMPQAFFDLFGPMQLELRTADGVTLRFWEEGVEFYPES